MPSSMFEHAKNVRISGNPTFQTINGDYYYHDHTSNTTNNNTTNITGNDFSQTVHNHNTYTVAHSQNYNEGDRRSQNRPEGGSAVPPHVNRGQTMPALSYAQPQFSAPDGQILRQQTIPSYYPNPLPISTAYMHGPPLSMNGVPYTDPNYNYALFQPGDIVAMSPQVSDSITQFFRGLQEQMSREEESERGRIEDAEYQEVPPPPPPPSQHAHASQLGYLPPPRSFVQPLYSSSMDRREPPASHRVTHEQPSATSYMPHSAPYGHEQPHSQQHPSSSQSQSSIPARVRRTLQAAFAFNSNLGSPSQAPVHTSTTSSSIDFGNATSTSSDLPFAYENLNATAYPQGVRMEVYDGEVVETRRTENVTTQYSAVVTDSVPYYRHWEEGAGGGEGEGVYGEERMYIAQES